MGGAIVLGGPAAALELKTTAQAAKVHTAVNISLGLLCTSAPPALGRAACRSPKSGETKLWKASQLVNLCLQISYYNKIANLSQILGFFPDFALFVQICVGK